MIDAGSQIITAFLNRTPLSPEALTKMTDQLRAADHDAILEAETLEEKEK